MQRGIRKSVTVSKWLRSTNVRYRTYQIILPAAKPELAKFTIKAVAEITCMHFIVISSSTLSPAVKQKYITALSSIEATIFIQFMILFVLPVGQ